MSQFQLLCICLFDLLVGGAGLKPIAFGSRSCNNNKKTSIRLLTKEYAADGLSLKKEILMGVSFLLAHKT